MNDSKDICLIGPTASGKTALALAYAHRHHGVILSLDSLSVYREIDIASAKPTIAERGNIPHFGIDVLSPAEPFDVRRFIDLYHEASAYARASNRPLVLVGGSGFYLKMLLEGISPLPALSAEVKEHVARLLLDLPAAYAFLQAHDPLWAESLAPNDRYRIEKALLIYYGSGTIPSEYHRLHPPHPVISQNLPIYEITSPRSLLRQQISQRTDRMLHMGLIDEVCRLEQRYSREPHPMKAIGITEVLSYLDGDYSREVMREKIITHTARLAKRQVTFNKSQFPQSYPETLEKLEEKLLGR